MRPVEVSPTIDLGIVQEGKSFRFSDSLRCILVYFRIKICWKKQSIETPLFMEKFNYINTSKRKKLR